MWWLGLPPGVRGKVWKRAIGNDLNISPGEVPASTGLVWMYIHVCIYYSVCILCVLELYQISLSRCREKLATMQSRSRAGE